MSWETLKRNIISVHKDVGQSWIRELPRTLQVLKEQWQLGSIEPIDNMTYHYVARTTHPTYGPVILKFGPDKEVFQHERDALSHFQGQGCISLYESNEALSALLLQQVKPGTSLLSVLYDDADQAIAGYAEAFLTLHKSPSMPNLNEHKLPLRHTKDWLSSIQTDSLNRLPPPIKIMSQQLISNLLKSPEPVQFLHGDLHADNVIKNLDSWVVIDPKGIMGERVFEASCFEFVSLKELLSDAHVKSNLQKRLHALA